MLTRDIMELIVSAVTFLVMGMFLGNLILIILGIFPILFLSLGLLIGQPRSVEIVRKGEDQKIWVDSQVSDTITATVKGGVGLVTFGDVLPPSFRLDKGTNFKVLWKGVREKEATIDYTATCAKRGYHHIKTVSWEAHHPLQITQNTIGEYPAQRVYIVQPKPLLVKRIREKKALTNIPMPMEARIKFGFPTTEFKEIRDYQPGDSYKNINWKVTARLLSSRPGALQINEFEKEGKKVVWIFLDSAAHMALGTTVRNTLEYAIRAVLGFAHFYLSRECQVGLCIYDYDAHEWEGAYLRTDGIPPTVESALKDVDQMETEVAAGDEASQPTHSKPQIRSRIILPEMGKRQQYRIWREILNVDIKYSAESLREAIHSCRRHIVGTLPLFIIVTMVEALKIEGIINGIKELYKYSGKLQRRPAIIVFNVQGYNIAAQNKEETIAAELLDYHNKPVYEALRGLGVTVVNWNPITQTFAQALIKQRA